MPEDLRARITNDFTYHPPRDDAQRQLYSDLRQRYKDLAYFLVDNVPHGRELSTALTDLERSSMMANAGIARRG